MTSMPDDTTTLAQAPRPAPPPVHIRVGQGLRRPHNWVQFVKFMAVGGSGYAVNIGVYALVPGALGTAPLRSAPVAWVVGVFNIFGGNRHWTFGAKAGHAGFQAARFFAVSTIAFFFALGISQ